MKATGSVDPSDARMVECGHGFALGLETRPLLGIVAHPAVHDLQRDAPVQRLIARFVHHAHTAFTAFAHDAIVVHEQRHSAGRAGYYIVIHLDLTALVPAVLHHPLHSEPIPRASREGEGSDRGAGQERGRARCHRGDDR